VFRVVACMCFDDDGVGEHDVRAYSARCASSSTPAWMPGAWPP
jgi:hypothetical protein